MFGSVDYIPLILSILGVSIFVKAFLTLHILRIGLGLQQFGVGVVVFILATFISLWQLPFDINSVSSIVSEPEKYNKKVIEKYLSSNTNPKIKKKISSYQKKKLLVLPKDVKYGKESGEEQNKSLKITKRRQFYGKVVGFLLSEVSQACKFGIIIILPFLVIDILIAHLLTLVGAVGISSYILSLPIKLALFVSLDGWSLIVGKIL